MPLAIPVAWSRAAARAVVAVCAFTLLATAAAVAPGPVGATGLGDQISANRSGQLYAERSMRAQDQILAAVKGDLKRAKRDLKRAKRDRKRAQQAAGDRLPPSCVSARAGWRVWKREYDDTAEPPSPERYAERLRGIRREIRIAERRKRTIGIRAPRSDAAWSTPGRRVSARSSEPRVPPSRVARLPRHRSRVASSR